MICWIVSHDWQPWSVPGPSWPIEDDEQYIEVCFRCNQTR
jgi:hypothetical protein